MMVAIRYTDNRIIHGISALSNKRRIVTYFDYHKMRMYITSSKTSGRKSSWNMGCCVRLLYVTQLHPPTNCEENPVLKKTGVEH